MLNPEVYVANLNELVKLLHDFQEKNQLTFPEFMILINEVRDGYEFSKRVQLAQPQKAEQQPIDAAN